MGKSLESEVFIKIYICSSSKILFHRTTQNRIKSCLPAFTIGKQQDTHLIIFALGPLGPAGPGGPLHPRGLRASRRLRQVLR